MAQLEVKGAHWPSSQRPYPVPYGSRLDKQLRRYHTVQVRTDMVPPDPSLLLAALRDISSYVKRPKWGRQHPTSSNNSLSTLREAMPYIRAVTEAVRAESHDPILVRQAQAMQ